MMPTKRKTTVAKTEQMINLLLRANKTWGGEKGKEGRRKREQ